MNPIKKIKSALEIGALGNMATLLVVVAITIAIGALILTNVAASDSIEAGAANDTLYAGMDALAVFGDWLVIIAIVIVAIVVLALIKYL